jgi:hypothetical protein
MTGLCPVVPVQCSRTPASARTRSCRVSQPSLTALARTDQPLQSAALPTRRILRDGTGESHSSLILKVVFSSNCLLAVWYLEWPGGPIKTVVVPENGTFFLQSKVRRPTLTPQRF